jgi:hypothetical protein
MVQRYLRDGFIKNPFQIVIKMHILTPHLVKIILISWPVLDCQQQACAREQVSWDCVPKGRHRLSYEGEKKQILEEALKEFGIVPRYWEPRDIPNSHVGENLGRKKQRVIEV